MHYPTTTQTAELSTSVKEVTTEHKSRRNATLETNFMAMDTDEEVVDASASLTITNDGYDLSINTTGLTAGHAATAWWVIYHKPDECSGGVCDQDDDSLVSFSFAGGQVVDEGGTANFKAHKSIFEVKDGAEIQFMIRDHVPVVPDIVEDQLSKPGGGCTNFPPKQGPNECVDVQMGKFEQSTETAEKRTGGARLLLWIPMSAMHGPAQGDRK